MSDLTKPWLEHYSSWVPATLPEPTVSMADVLEAAVRRRPDAPALCYFDRVLSFAELDDLASRFAALLRASNIGHGDRVAIYLQNVPQFVVAMHGAWKRGAVVVPLNPMFKQAELRYHLGDSGARLLVCLESSYELVSEVLAGSTVERVLTTSELDFVSAETIASAPTLAGVKRQRAPGVDDLLEALAAVAPDRERVPVAPSDVASLGYTSGTTGQPKGAMTTHRNLVFNAEVYRTWMKMGDDDIVLGVAPLFHITGMVGHLALGALAAIPVVLFHRFEPRQAFAIIDRWRPTMTVGSITVYLALMNHPDAGQHDLSCFSKCYSGGAPVAPSITEQFEKQFGVYIHNIYGLTESTSPTHAVPLGARSPVDPVSGALSVGVPIPSCEAKLVDVDAPERAVTPGEPGEFAARGPMIFAGYWGKPEATEKAFREGYFLTGDVAIMDADGFFYVVDRKKDMIVVSGYKVWPREVEDLLYQHPAVREASVIGVPDGYRGETVKAFVALRANDAAKGLTPEALIDFCKERIAAYKYPRFVEFVDEIPKTVTGKFLRRELRTREGASNAAAASGSKG